MRASPITAGTIQQLEALLERTGNEEKRESYLKAAGFANNKRMYNSLQNDADRELWNDGRYMRDPKDKIL